MAVTLKSISRRIHWSLALKAAFFALAWLVLPFWLFFLIALYLYFVPLFQAGKLAVPYFVLLLLCFLQGHSIFSTLLFAVIFYALFLIKDLLVIDRRATHELLVFVLSFLLVRDFYIRFDQGVAGGALFYAFLVAVVLALLVRNFLRQFPAEPAGPESGAHRGTLRVAGWLSFMLFTQVLITGLFLPLDFIYQSALVFLFVVLVVELFQEYFTAGSADAGLSRNGILATAMTIFALFVIVLSSARWSL